MKCKKKNNMYKRKNKYRNLLSFFLNCVTWITSQTLIYYVFSFNQLHTLTCCWFLPWMKQKLMKMVNLLRWTFLSFPQQINYTTNILQNVEQIQKQQLLLCLLCYINIMLKMKAFELCSLKIELISVLLTLFFYEIVFMIFLD